jgi:hypothetical protein
MDEGRTARQCSAYERTQRPSVVSGLRAAAAKVVRVRTAGEVVQRISIVICRAARAIQVNYTSKN